MTPREDVQISDEMLVAYVDGELGDTDAARVEAALAADPELARSMKMLALSGTLACDAFALPEPSASDPVAEMITGSMRGGSDSNVVPFAKMSRRQPTPATGWALPIAASIVLVAATVVGTMVLNSGGSSTTPSAIATGPLPPGSDLATLLETKPSGTHVPVTIAGITAPFDAAVVSTFEAPDKRICREVELSPEIAEAPALTVALACRDGQGRWSVKGAVTLASTHAGRPDFKPASGADEHAVEQLLATERLAKAVSPDHERELLARGWK